VIAHPNANVNWIANTNASTNGASASVRGTGSVLPSYLPPRAFTRANSSSTQQGGTATTNVRPLRALAGHGAGAVFDVRARGDALLSTGEDGAVGVWGDE
jgi:hypothetical protein